MGFRDLQSNYKLYEFTRFRQFAYSFGSHVKLVGYGAYFRTWLLRASDIDNQRVQAAALYNAYERLQMPNKTIHFILLLLKYSLGTSDYITRPLVVVIQI